MNMLRFSQTILQKVSFDERLFEKELRKAIDKLTNEDAEALRDWCQEHFPQRSSAITRSFNGRATAA